MQCKVVKPCCASFFIEYYGAIYFSPICQFINDFDADYDADQIICLSRILINLNRVNHTNYWPSIWFGKCFPNVRMYCDVVHRNDKSRKLLFVVKFFIIFNQDLTYASVPVIVSLTL